MRWFDFFRPKSAPAPPVTILPERQVIVAEVNFDRDAPATELRRLGEALAACRETHDWIGTITGLAALLKGECPEHWSKGVGTSGTDSGMRGFYDPILIWGRVPTPGGPITNAPDIIGLSIPLELGQVDYPTPDGGL